MKTKNKSQKEKVLAYMQRGFSLTPLQALNMFGSFRLGAIIWSLKEEGHKISSAKVSIKTRTGKAIVSAYRLLK